MPAAAPKTFTLKLFYFCFFGALGAVTPFLQLFYRDSGLDIAQIGLLATLGGAIGALAGPLWAVIADAFRLGRVLLPLCMVLSLGMILLLGQMSTFAAIAAAVALYAFVGAPIAPLADSGVVGALGERRELYGAQRLWGSLGWAITNLVVGALVTRVGVWVIFPAAVALGLPAVVVATRLPQGNLARASLRSGARQLAGDRGWLVFMVSAVLLGVCVTAATGFSTSYLRDIGAGGDAVGAAFALGALVEIPVMGLTARIIRRFTARRTLAFAALLYALCSALQSVIVDPWLAVAVQAIRGAGYGLFWTAGVLEAQALAPRGMSATAQSLFGTATSSAPSLFFTAPAGMIYRDLGYAWLFRIGALAGLGAAAGVLSGRPREATARDRNTGQTSQ